MEMKAWEKISVYVCVCVCVCVYWCVCVRQEKRQLARDKKQTKEREKNSCVEMWKLLENQIYQISKL